jgi:hypothetical protein
VVVAQINDLVVAKATGSMPQNVNFAISLGTLRRFLQNNHVQILESELESNMKPHDIAKIARKYTVAIDCWK